MVEDPVCYMQVDRQKAESQGLVSEYQGKKYYFCSSMCKQQFDKFAERFVRRQAA